MPGFLSTVILVLIVLYLWGRVRSHRESELLYKFVAWCVSKDDLVYRCNLSLLHYVHNAQISLKISDSHSIRGDIERGYAKSILDGFTSYLCESYFCHKINRDNLRKLGKWEKIDGYFIEIHFFMFQLYNYLSSHQCDSHFLGQDMHCKTLSRKDYGMWGGPLYDATYELTDFAVVFHKMLYISYMFCKNSSIYADVISKYATEQSYIDVINTKQISISRH